jgi:hypothetical protein
MADDAMAHGPLSLLVDLGSGDIFRMEEMTLASVGLRERQDLQRWITAHPDLIAPGLLLVTTEFDRWAIRNQKVEDRLDALFLDTSGAPVVAELKRDRASDTVELQAFKYAAYCSQLTLEELAEDYAATHAVMIEEARAQLLDHAPALEDGGLRAVKIRLVAGSFGPSVTSVVLWLRDYGIDIGCVEVSARRVAGSNQAVISARQLLPLAEAEDYLVRRREKEQEEDCAREQPAESSWESYEARYPASRVEVARRLFDDMTQYVKEHQLPWTPALRSWYLGYKRPGGYYVSLIHLHVDNPVALTVKIPDEPDLLGLANPYPNLKSLWRSNSREWSWDVPTIGDMPDVQLAIEISRRFQPENGPMAPAQASATSVPPAQPEPLPD